MALDTSNELISVMALVSGGVLPIPSVSIDQGDLQTLLELYRGLLAGASIPMAERMISKLLIIRG